MPTFLFVINVIFFYKKINLGFWGWWFEGCSTYLLPFHIDMDVSLTKLFKGPFLICSYACSFLDLPVV